MFTRLEAMDPAITLCKDLIFLILQFFDEENLKRTAHMLEQETGCFFDVKYFENLMIEGYWDEAEKYLSGFTGVEDNRHSTKIYFEIRKQKFLEALDRNDSVEALSILQNDLKVFAQLNAELYKEMTQLLTLEDFREHPLLATYGDTFSARECVAYELRSVVEANPLLLGKTKFPQCHKSRLRRLINQGLNWQHNQCLNPHPQPCIETLFTDHWCLSLDNVKDSVTEDSLWPPKTVSHVFENQFKVTKPIILAGDVNVENKSFAGEEAENGKSCHNTEKENMTQVELCANFRTNCKDSANELLSDFPKTVKAVLSIGTSPTSMKFHPFHQTLLLVGTNVGDIEIWDVPAGEQLFRTQFISWKAKSRLDMFLNEENSPGISINRVVWSPDGAFFGVAYSMCLVRLYSYRTNGNCVQNKLEIDAHVGSVNDLAFSEHHNKLMAISCGDDKLIQVWDAVTGAKHYTLEGHNDSVFSVCPHVKENIHFLFSISTRGEIKAWLFDNLRSRITYNAPGFCSMRLSYSSDGKRLFSCGTDKNGESYLVEWNEEEGFITRNYLGLCLFSSAMVQFDTCNNKFLAAGDDHLIKVWDVNRAEMLAAIEVDGGLPASSFVSFNKNGNLLAVFSSNNQIKVLANDRGFELPVSSSTGSVDSTPFLTETFLKLSVNSSVVNPKTRLVGRDISYNEVSVTFENERPAELYEPEMPRIPKVIGISRCQSVLLTSEVKTKMIRRLQYTNAGNGILALAQDGIHLLWRWSKNVSNPRGEASTKCAPQLWQPKSGLSMVNDLPATSLDLVIPCFCLSRNDSYIVSASGKMITLYNMLVFKKIRNVMTSPPAATCIVFYPPDNNIIVIGMDDSTIIIYNIRVDEVLNKLEGHSNRICGLAFSTISNVLISSGVDTQIVLWDSVTWEKRRSTMLESSISGLTSNLSEANIELEKDQKHFLVVHETQLAIYEVPTLQRVNKWAVDTFCTRISHATYSCDSQMVYAVMKEGILLILAASDLTPRFEIDSLAYLLPHLSCYVHPLVVAAHPHKPDQFALGLSNGRVVIVEPAESPGKWSLSTAI